MELIKIVIILFNVLILISADLNGPNYPTNYIAPVSGQLNLPVSQQTVGVNTLNNGILSSQNFNQLLYGANVGGSIGAGLNGLSGTNGLTNIQTTEIIRRQIQTSNLNALNGGASGIINPYETTTVIGANGLPVSTVNAVIDSTTGATIGYLGANWVVTPVTTAGNINPGTINSNGYQVVIGQNGVSTVVDRITGVTVGYVGANGIVTPVTTGINSLPTRSINNGYQVVTGQNGVNTVVDRVTGVTIGYVGANGIVTPVATGINNLLAGYPSTGMNNGYRVVTAPNGVNTVIDRITGVTLGYVGVNGAVIPVTTAGNINPATINSNGYQVVTGLNGVRTVIDRITGVPVGYVSVNGVVTPVTSNGLETVYGLTNAYQNFNDLGGMNNLYPSTGLQGQGIYPTTNDLINPSLNQYNAYQTGYGSLYPTTMGTGLNEYPYNTGFGMKGMNQYYGYQFGYNGYPYLGQFSGYPTNGNSNSNSQASASSKTF
uniref:Uncharacterized protein n=1 Tax=Panagrolaimus sp. PS1159 TaxID=55785 RepID=A0AC35GD17_9BILA